MKKWGLTKRILSTSCMFKCVSFQTCLHCTVGYLWVRNGSLPQAVSLCGESCVDGMLRCLFSVQAHCLLSRVFVYSVCACVCFWLNQQCWVQEFQFIRERERGRVSKIWASRREDGGPADNKVIPQHNKMVKYEECFNQWKNQTKTLTGEERLEFRTGCNNVF